MILMVMSKSYITKLMTVETERLGITNLVYAVERTLVNGKNGELNKSRAEDQLWIVTEWN
jgi:hypothetical protein